ncbi:TPA: ABC transporter transmembrane domain-containing protein [Salmonella enterica subsp. enterica serovar Typhimurium]
MMFVYSPRLATIALVVMLIYGVIRAVMYKPLRQATEENIVQGAKQQTHFLETIRGLKTIKLFNRQADRRESWLSLFIAQINAGLHVQKLHLVSQQVNGLLFGLEGLLIIWLGSRMVINGEHEKAWGNVNQIASLIPLCYFYHPSKIPDTNR